MWVLSSTSRASSRSRMRKPTQFPMAGVCRACLLVRKGVERQRSRQPVQNSLAPAQILLHLLALCCACQDPGFLVSAIWQVLELPCHRWYQESKMMSNHWAIIALCWEIQNFGQSPITRTAGRAQAACWSQAWGLFLISESEIQTSLSQGMNIFVKQSAAAEIHVA